MNSIEREREREREKILLLDIQYGGTFLSTRRNRYRSELQTLKIMK